MDKLYLDFNEDGLLTMFIEGNIDKFKSTLKFKNNKYFFGVEKRLIKDKNLIDKLKYEHVSLIPKVDTINCKKKEKIEPTNEEKYEVQGLPDDIIFDGKNFYNLVPLEWKDNGNNFTCLNTFYTKSFVKEILHKKLMKTCVMNDYLNDTILPEIFDVKEVDRTDLYEASYKIFNEVLEKIELPNHIKKIDINYENGKIILEKPKTLIKIDIPGEVRNIKCFSDDLRYKRHLLYNIFIPKTVKYIEKFLVNYDGKINQLVFDKNFDGEVVYRSLISFNEIINLKIPCNKALFKNIINIGNREFSYIFDKNSKLTLNYKNVKELLDFLNYFILLDKKLDSKKSRKYMFNKEFDKYVPGIEFMFDNKKWEYFLYDFRKKASLKDIEITLCGPQLSKKNQNKLKRMLKNDNVHFIVDEIEKTNEQNEKEITKEKQEENKTTIVANDIIEEILSIDYFGLDKENVKNKVNEILIKYNEDLANLKGGLSLQSEEGLYNNLLVKLNILKDSLYSGFEKNIEVYDMLDEVNILLSILNGEEVMISNSLEKDFYLLSNNILPFTNEKITDDLRNYLKLEKEKIENYLKTIDNKPYEDMKKFIISIRTYLNVTLLSIRNYLNKKDILSVINDYINMQMQINYQEPIKNYLSMILFEIDKTKKEILDIDPFNNEISNIINKINTNYSDMESNEIIKYLDSILIEIYRLHIDLKYNEVRKLKKESYKIKLL